MGRGAVGQGFARKGRQSTPYRVQTKYIEKVPRSCRCCGPAVFEDVMRVVLEGEIL
jgi:hypothetical protein